MGGHGGGMAQYPRAVDKRSLNERDICTKFITPALRRAGWDEISQIREEVRFTKGRIIVRGRMVRRGESKRADYILYYKPNIPIAVLEAKDNTRAMGEGIQQALGYADTLKIPFVFASNGDGFVFHDTTGQSPERERNLSLDEFPSPDALWAKYCAWKGIEPAAEAVVLQDYHDDDSGKEPRYYQRNAVNAAVVRRGPTRADARNRTADDQPAGMAAKLTAFSLRCSGLLLNLTASALLLSRCGVSMPIREVGTTVVAVWSPKRIVIAADGKVTRRNDPSLASFTACKIRVTAGIVAAAAGFYAHPATDYDFWREVELAASSKRPLSIIADLIESRVRPKLTNALAYSKRADPDGYRRDFSTEFLGVVIAGTVDGNPVMAGIEFFPGVGGNLEVQRTLFPPLNDPHPPAAALGFSVLGERAAIDRDFPDDKLIHLLRLDMASAAIRLIDLQIEATPDKVGPPISAIEITSTGLRWISQGACRQLDHANDNSGGQP